MDAKTFFREALEAAHEIKDLELQLDHYRDMIGGVSARLSPIVTAKNNHSRVEDIALNLAEIEGDITDRMFIYTERIKAAGAVVAQLKSYRQRQVLTLRYLCGHSWKTITDEMGYSEPKSVYRMHGWALISAQKILDQQENSGLITTTDQ